LLAAYSLLILSFQGVNSNHLCSNNLDVIIAPKRPVYKYTDMNPAEVFEFSTAVKYLTEILPKITQKDSCTIYIKNYDEKNTTKESINHVHMHIVPRSDKDLEN
jgi:diadenosine tetraphosphate (Ap4A) HIT family hydrolase